MKIVRPGLCPNKQSSGRIYMSINITVISLQLALSSEVKSDDAICEIGESNTSRDLTD